MKVKRQHKVPMTRGSSRQKWNTTIYEHYGKEYILSATFKTKKEADRLKKDIEKHPQNEALVRKEGQVWRTYSRWGSK